MSQKVPINPILDDTYKNLIKNQSGESGVSQSDLVSKLIDATQLLLSNDSEEEAKLGQAEFASLIGKLSGFAMAGYGSGETESKPRRFYVRSSQREWLKDQGGISDTIRLVLTLYLFGDLDSYLPPEFRMWPEEGNWRFTELKDEMADELEDKISNGDD